MKRIILVLPLVLAGCTSAQLQTADAVAPVVVQTAEAVDPAISPAVASACQYASPIAAATPTAVKLSGGASKTEAYLTGLVVDSCSKDGQKKLTINDTLPVTATNSGNSGKWVTTVATALQVLQALAPVAEIAVKAAL